ncbi:hypothetical protein [Geofilum rubicundum]|uniref:hypothetical protein n=1 Tax=Geofilum rubicundum TaxID=472113 RepID=UPI0012FCDFEB|nr:hypothetical protein [Geofilum rubicundum]
MVAVKKPALFERSEFAGFRRATFILDIHRQRRPFLASLNFATFGIDANKFDHCAH